MSSSQFDSDVEIVGEMVDPRLFENDENETRFRYFGICDRLPLCTEFIFCFQVFIRLVQREEHLVGSVRTVW
jgi:hypothetical protein